MIKPGAFDLNSKLVLLFLHVFIPKHNMLFVAFDIFKNLVVKSSNYHFTESKHKVPLLIVVAPCYQI